MSRFTIPAAPPLGQDALHFTGIIRLRRLPEEWTPQQYRYWWCAETDGRGRVLRQARISEREKERYTEGEFYNLLTVAGRAQILSYIGASTGSTIGFAKYLAIGTGALQSPSPVDTSLAGEVFRKALASFTVQGTQVDCSFLLASADANVTMTNAGLFGNAATSTLGSGTLYTKALFSYSKGAYSISADYLINLY